MNVFSQFEREFITKFDCLLLTKQWNTPEGGDGERGLMHWNVFSYLSLFGTGVALLGKLFNWLRIPSSEPSS
jgi:hypothetical protein